MNYIAVCKWWINVLQDYIIPVKLLRELLQGLYLQSKRYQEYMDHGWGWVEQACRKRATFRSQQRKRKSRFYGNLWLEEKAGEHQQDFSEEHLARRHLRKSSQVTPRWWKTFWRQGEEETSQPGKQVQLWQTWIAMSPVNGGLPLWRWKSKGRYITKETQTL